MQYLKLKKESKRLELRPYKLTDFSRCKEARWNSLPLVNKYDGVIPICKCTTYEEFKKKVEGHRKVGKQGTHFLFGIFSKRTGELVGQIDIFKINEGLRWGNLGYHTINNHWGKGYASEASRMALKLAFDEMGFHRIEAGIEPQNKASIKVAKKIKMEKEGLRKKFFPDNGGIDIVIYGTNKIDYK